MGLSLLLKFIFIVTIIICLYNLLYVRKFIFTIINTVILLFENNLISLSDWLSRLFNLSTACSVQIFCYFFHSFVYNYRISLFLFLIQFQ